MFNPQQAYGTGFFIRASSFCAEPPMFAFALIPATFISLYCYITGNFKILSKVKSLIIITAMIFTYSAIGYFSLLLSVIILLLWCFNNIKIKNFILILFLSIFLFSLGGNEIVSRITDVITLQQNDIKKYTFRTVTKDENKKGKIYIEKGENNVNSSSYLLMVHFKRTLDDFYENPILGKGLGAYTYTKNSIKLKKYAVANFPSLVPFRLVG